VTFRWANEIFLDISLIENIVISSRVFLGFYYNTYGNSCCIIKKKQFEGMIEQGDKSFNCFVGAMVFYK
jgi:hypothetical protein